MLLILLLILLSLSFACVAYLLGYLGGFPALYKKVLKILKNDTPQNQKAGEILKLCTKYNIREKVNPQKSKADKLLVVTVSKIQGNEGSKALARVC